VRLSTNYYLFFIYIIIWQLGQPFQPDHAIINEALRRAGERESTLLPHEDLIDHHQKKANVFVYGGSKQKYHSAITAQRPDEWCKINETVSLFQRSMTHFTDVQA
jgi:hypothetical protein